MPFTPSHAVVALPFVRTPLVPAAVAVGAMTPDLPLFLRGTPLTYAVTHNVAALWVTVPVAFVLLLVWYAVMRPAVRDLVPRALASRLPEDWDAGAVPTLRAVLVPWRRLAWIVLALAVGVVSHIVWDLFTHEGRVGGELFPVLEEMWGPWAGYRWMQYASGVVGLLVLAVWGARWISLRRREALDAVIPSTLRWAWWLSLPVALAVGWSIGYAQNGPLDDAFGVRHLAYLALPPACAVWGVLTLALCLTVQVVRRGRSPRKTARHARDAA